MIRHFEHAELQETEGSDRFQWVAALAAGFIPGVVLLLVPRGSPWSSLTAFAYVIMGRALPSWFSMPLPLVWFTHIVVAEIYGLIISWFVQRITRGRAALTGLIIGLVLYLLNLAMVSVVWPAWRGNEGGVIFTHAVFGLIAGAAYRGLLRRRVR